MNTTVIYNVFFLETHKINVRSGGRFNPLVSSSKFLRGLGLNLILFIYTKEMSEEIECCLYQSVVSMQLKFKCYKFPPKQFKVQLIVDLLMASALSHVTERI
jgi:hypothetical protein